MSVHEVAAPPSPYKGLASFEDSSVDALFFFGRERESEIVAANLLAYRLTVLYGASGVGKSSLLGAGVTHRLRRQGDAVVVFDAWSGDPVASILDEVRGQLETPVPDDESGELAGSLGVWTAALGGELYLILDQFDEYFLYHESEDEFARELAEVVTRPGLPVNILISIRDDMLARLDQFKALIPNLFSNYLRLDHLDRQAAHAAIVGPIESYNTLVPAEERVTADPELVEAVLDGSASWDGRIEAPYLQLVMQRLWEEEHRRRSRTLTLGTLVALGGAGEIVRAHLADALESLSSRDRDLAAKLFNHLVTPSGTKIAHGIGDLAKYASVSEREVAPVLAALAAERILRPVTTGQPDGSRFEIFHDVLAEPVTAWRSQHEAERELATERQTAKRRHRRMLAVTVASLVALAAMVGVTIFALQQRNLANQQAETAKKATRDVGKLAKRLHKRNDKLKEKQKALDENQKALDENQKALDKNQKELDKNQKELDETNNELNETNETLNQNKATLKTQNETLKQNKATLKTQNETLKQNQKTLNEKNETLKQNKKTLKTKNKKLEKNKAKSQGEQRKASRRGPKAKARHTHGDIACIPRRQSRRAVSCWRFGLPSSNHLKVEDALRRALLAMNMRLCWTQERARHGGRVRPRRQALLRGRGRSRHACTAWERVTRFERSKRVPRSSLPTLSPDGSRLAIGTGRRQRAHLGRPDRQSDPPGPAGASGRRYDRFISDDASSSSRATITRSRLWDVITGIKRHSFKYPQKSLVPGRARMADT